MLSRARDLALPRVAKTLTRPTSGDPERVLILQPDHLGDILLSQPAVRLIRDNQPTAHIVAAVGPWSEYAARRFWPVDEVAVVSYPGFDRSGRSGRVAPYTLLARESRRLQSERFGLAVALRPDGWWSAWLAATVAVDIAASDDPRVAPFATRIASVSDTDHATARAMSIAAEAVGARLPSPLAPSGAQLSIAETPEERAEADRALRSAGVRGRYVVVHPGSGAPVKEWPKHRWQAVVRSLASDGLQVVITGSISEAAAAREIAGATPGAVSIAGSTSLDGLIGVLRRASVAVGTDNGPLHIAVGVDTPSVRLYGPSNPARYGPWGDALRHRVLSSSMTCPRCGDLSLARPAGCGCMLAISVEMTRAAVRELLGHA